MLPANRTGCRRIGILLALFVFPSFGAEPYAAAAVPTDAGARTAVAVVSQAHELEAHILAELNRIRRARGLRPLKKSPRLGRAADAHLRALALAGQFRHEWTNGRRYDRWIRRFYPVGGARFWAAGENLIWSTGDLSATRAAQVWLASPPHRRVLLAPYWRELGIGAVYAVGAQGVYGGSDVVIAAAEFGARS
jgi:uncharacterized protein YkwD